MAHRVWTLNRNFTKNCHQQDHKYLTPHERQFPGDRPDLRSMAKFGCKTLVYVDKNNRAMNVNHAYFGYFAGYTYNMKGYNVYSPTRAMCIKCFMCGLTRGSCTRMSGDLRRRRQCR